MYISYTYLKSIECHMWVFVIEFFLNSNNRIFRPERKYRTPLKSGSERSMFTIKTWILFKNRDMVVTKLYVLTVYRLDE